METVLKQIWFIKSNDPFRRALSRGISFHHAGVGAKMRGCVEILYRQQFMKVGISGSHISNSDSLVSRKNQEKLVQGLSQGLFQWKLIYFK